MKASFLFITYNQERFVADSIRSAMAQDYPEFELVVCDDASSDKTRAILEKELEQCPPHIKLIRSYSTKNDGLLLTFNRGVKACTGDVVIGMAGDDISLPNRMSAVCREFAADPDCMLVFSNWKLIDTNGKDLGTPQSLSENKVFSYTTTKNQIYAKAPVCGAAASYRKSLWNLFPPMVKGKHGEDNCSWVRALLTGNIHYIAEPLILWRTHDKNQSNSAQDENRDVAKAKHLQFLHAHQCLNRQWMRDLSHARETKLISPEEYERLELLIYINREEARLTRLSVEPAPWGLWFASARRLLRAGARSGSLKKTFRYIRRRDFRFRASRKMRDETYWAYYLDGKDS